MRQSVVLSLALVSAAAAAAAGSQLVRLEEPAHFEELSLVLEANMADLDGEVVLHAETGQPIEKLALVSPTGQLLHMIDASGGGGIGLSELRLETGEPSVADVQLVYPEGEYLVRAISTTGQLFMDKVCISHELPSDWSILSPQDGDVIPRDGVLVEWSTDSIADRYTLEIEDAEDEQRLLATMQMGVSSFEVPASLLLPDTDYQVVVVAHAESGNRVVRELFFRTAP